MSTPHQHDITLSVSDELLWGIFVTALEGGIGYWSQATAYRPWKPGGGHEENHQGFYATIIDTVVYEPEEEPTHLRIDREVILKGLRQALGPKPGVAPRIVADAMQEVSTGQGGYLDAEGADCIVQLGLFGQLVYG